MQEIVTYWVRAAAVLAVFYLFFKILLSHETFHRLNRAVLLATSALSFLLPLCVITIHRTITIEEGVAIAISEQAEALESVARATTSQVDLWSIASLILLLGAVVVVAWSIRAIISVYRIIGNCREIERSAKYRVLVSEEDITSFSWFGNIVLSESDLSESGEAILTHEKAHAALHHSVDMLFINLCCALQWFNPAMWLIRRDLQEIHEYEADEAVLLSGVNAKQYQLLLIKKAVGNKSHSIANSLNHSTLKNRITMMLQKKSTRASRMRVLYVLPLVCISLTAFAKTETTVQFADKATENFSEKQTTGPIITLRGDAILLNGQRVGIDNLADALAQCNVLPQTVINISTEGNVKTSAVAAVKEVLRENGYLRICYDNTTQRIMMPPTESGSEDVEVVPFTIVHPNNIMRINIWGDNSLRISYGGTEQQMQYNDRKIRKAVKAFVENKNNSDKLPDKQTTTFTLPDGREWSYDVSREIIVIATDDNADFDIHKKTVEAIYQAYGELRDEAAKELFGRTLDQLTPEEQAIISMAIPINLSEVNTR